MDSDNIKGMICEDLTLDKIEAKETYKKLALKRLEKLKIPYTEMGLFIYGILIITTIILFYVTFSYDWHLKGYKQLILLIPFVLLIPFYMLRKMRVNIIKKRAKAFLLEDKDTNIYNTSPNLDTIKKSLYNQALREYYFLNSHRLGRMFKLIKNKITNKFIVKDIGVAYLRFNDDDITLLIKDKKYCHKTFNLNDIVSFKTVIIEELYDGPSDIGIEDLQQLQAYENYSLQTSIRDSIEGGTLNSIHHTKAAVKAKEKRNEIVKKIKNIESRKKSKTVVQELVLNDGSIYLFNDLSEGTVKKLEKIIDEMFV